MKNSINQKHPVARIVPLLARILGVLLLAGATTQAAMITWTNTATAVWTSATAWNPNGAPSSANDYDVAGGTSTMQSVDAATSTFTGASVTVRNGATLYLFRTNGGTGISVNEVFTNTVAGTPATLTLSNANLNVATSLGTVTQRIKTPVSLLGTNTISYLANGTYALTLYFDAALTGSGAVKVVRSASGTYKKRDLYLGGDCSGYSGNWTVTGNGTGTAGSMNMTVTHVSGWGGGNLTAGAYTVLNIGAGLTNPAPQVNLNSATATLNVNNASTLGSLAGAASSTVNLNQSLTLAANNDSPVLGNVSGAGSLTKTGGGTLTLGNANLSGGLTNNAGALIAAGYVGGLSLGAGTAFSPGAAALTAGLLSASGDLVLNTNTLNFDLSNVASSGNDQLSVGGNLTLNGVNKINLNLLNGVADNTGPYTIITYSGALTGGAANFQIVGSHAATIDLSVPGQVNLWFTNGAPVNLTWVGDGVNNFWDAGTSFDWFNGTGADYFGQGDNVTFNDSATNLTVNVAGTVSPGAFVVNAATNNYVIQGGGVIGGGATLVKSGAASLTVSNANAFSGGATVSAGAIYAENQTTPLGTGTITLGDGNTGTNNTALYLGYAANFTNSITVSADGTGTATLGGDQAGGPSGNSTTFAGPITLNRSLTLDSGAQLDRLHFGGVISGTGDLTLLGGHRIDLGGNNTFFGNLYIQGAGTLFETFGASCIPTTATVDVGSGSTFGLFYSATISALTGSGQVQPYGGTCTLTVGANDGSGTFSGILTNSGAFLLSLVKTGNGTQTINGPDYRSANTTVNAGTLAIGAGGSLGVSPVITVASGATLDVSAQGGAFALGAGQTLTGAGAVSGGFNVSSNAVVSPSGGGTPATFAFNNDLTLTGGAVLALDLTGDPTPGSGINDLITVGGNLTAGGVTVISLSATSQQSLVPGTYTLIQYSGTLTGGAANFVVSPVLTRLTLTVDTSTAGQVNLVVSGSHATGLVWNGGLNGNAWDVAITTNWLNGANPDVFYQQDGVVFNDVGGVNSSVNLTTTLYPSAVTVNSASNYVFGGSGQIAGAAALTVAGPGSLTLGTTNSYTGGTTVSGGTLNLNNAAAAGAGAIALGANTLGVNIGAATLPNAITGAGTINVTETANANSYFGGDLSGFTGTINLPTNPGGTAKAGIASGTVNLNSAATVNVAGGGTFYLNGAAVNVAATVQVAGSGNSENYGALRVDGGSTVSGPVVLTGNATIGMNNGAGSISGVISDGGNGYGFTKVGGQALTLSGNNTYTGPTIADSGTVTVNGDQSAATGGWSVASGSTTTVNFQSGSTVVVGATNEVQVGTWPANGTASKTLNANGVVTNNGSLLVTRTGYLNVNGGATWVQNGPATNEPPTGSGYSSYLTVASGGTFIYNGPGTFKLEPSDGNTGIGTFTVAGTVITSQGFERTVNTSAANPVLALNGGTIQLAANVPALASSPLVTTGGVLTVQMAAGGGTFDTAGYSTAISNAVSGAGSLTKIGAGTLSLPFTNTYTGATYVNGGTLQVDGALNPASSVSVNAGATLAGIGNIGGATLIYGGGAVQPGAGVLTIPNLTLGASPSDVCTGAFNVGAGAKIATTTLTVTGTNVINILDATLPVGTNDLIYYSGVIGGNGLAGLQLGTLPAGVTAQLIDNPGVSVQLAVTSGNAVNTNSPVMVSSVSGNTLTLSWPADHLGWRLEVQTNALSTGLTGNWVTWPGSTSVTTVPVTIDRTNPTMFFRLVYP